MPDVTIAYKNSTITSLSSSGAVALSTAGKYLEDDLTITYTVPLPNLSSINIKPENCTSISTQITPETYICETDSSYPGTVISFNNTQQKDIGNPLPNNIKIELNKTYHCDGQLLIKWDDDNTEEYYYINSDFKITSYTTIVSLSFTWEGSTGAVQTFSTIYIKMNSYQPYGYQTILRVVRNGAITKSGVLLPGSFYRITQPETEGYGVINLDFNSDPRFYKIYQSLAYRSMIASSAPGVSEWCNSLSSFITQQFAGQPFSGNFTFNNISSITYYVFGSVNTGTVTGQFSYFGLNFPSCSSIYTAAFIANQYLQSVSFPECITIGSSAFQSCTRLTTISFPKCTTIANSAFQSCTSLTTISFPECTSIANSAFQSCTRLTTISFPECTSIGASTFTSCTSLTTVSFPKCTTIGNYAFYNCSNLTTISFPSCTSIGNSAFYNCSNLTTISFPECTSIGNSAFYNCSNLTTISFPSCTSIGSSAFYNCFALTAVSFPNCTSIGWGTFSNCYSLFNTSFPNCTFIDGYAFYSCSALTVISFPNCTSIGGYVFRFCINLSSFYFMGSSIPSISSATFANTTLGTSSYLGYFGSIYVPSSLLDSYKTATNWTVYSARMVGI